MAIARDAASRTGSGGSANPYSYNYTATGSNLVMVDFGLYFNASGTDILSGITYNGASLTKVNASNNLSNAYYTSMWYLIAPSTGVNSLSHSFSATPSGSWFTTATYTGCNQSSQPDASGVAQNNTSSYTLNLTTIADDSWFIGYSAGNRTTTAGTNTTQVVADSGGLGFLGEYSSNPIATAGAISMNFSQVPGAYNGIHWLSLSPAGDTPLNTTNFFYMN